jgi:hypothetical protein
MSLSVSVAGLLAVALAQRASATAVTLETDVDPQAVEAGTVFTVVVGLDDLDEILGYTLGVAWSGDRLTLVDAEEIACAQAGPSDCEREPFTVDPLDEITPEFTTRAGVLAPPPLTLFLDGRTTSPAPDPRPGLFALTFQAVEAGPAEVTSGLLEAAADGVVGLDDLVPLDPIATTLSFEIVPEPGAVSGIAAAVLALAALARARRAA